MEQREDTFQQIEATGETASYTEGQGRVRLYAISSLIFTIAVSLCLIFSVQILTKGYVSIAGRSLFRVVTGSMEPTIPTGAVLVCQKTDIDTIQEGDIICYRTKVQEIYGSIVTHRVVAIETDDTGAICLETRGDANLSSDPYYVTESNLVGKVIWYSGQEGVLVQMIGFLNGKIGFLACIVFPICLLAGLILQSSVKSIRKDMLRLEQRLRQEEEQDTRQEDSFLEGYTTITREDYEAIYRSLYEELSRELLEERNGNEEGTRG
jgi:signal peptidase